jgi:ABC-type branched-subunit amino acid transport system ATPase component
MIQTTGRARPEVGSSSFPSYTPVDEPSLGLAPAMVELTFESLARAKTLGLTIVLIEQFVHRALYLGGT